MLQQRGIASGRVAEEAPLPLSWEQPPTTTPIDLLIIDSCAASRGSIRLILSSFRPSTYRFREAATAAMGAAEISERIPECVLMDCDLPDQHGVNLLKEFAAAEVIACPFILISDSDDASGCARAFGGNARDFLSKKNLSGQIWDNAISHAVARYRSPSQLQQPSRSADNDDLMRAAQEAGRVGDFEWHVESGKSRFGGAYFALYGLPPDHPGLSFTEWLELIHPEDRNRVRSEIGSCLLNNSDFSFEFRVLLPNGAVRWILSRGAVRSGANGRCLTGVNVDISETKEVELALLTENAELQEFAYMAGHDLQAPLRTISVFAELLEQTFNTHPDTRIRQAIQQVTQSAERMRAVIGDLLEFARAGNPVEPVATRKPLQAALDTALGNLHSEIQATGARISTAGLDTVCSFGPDLPHVFQNLIGNAIKYRKLGTTPEIRVTCEAQRGGHVVAVHDSGIGFAPEHSTRIFQPFQRLAGAHIPGTGLGLPICKRLVERNGGRIWAEGSPGAGAAFYFSLPAA
jgi:signal transduction histidine kinase/DNA-binding NarL/FixJ family response regulator